ncbi:hypothetical protein J6590_036074 [Homalodisca vitripennis]|nr:hypothetical protein J6590_036074 [Homalodisca vitripennis]
MAGRQLSTATGPTAGHQNKIGNYPGYVSKLRFTGSLLTSPSRVVFNSGRVQKRLNRLNFFNCALADGFQRSEIVTASSA